MISIIIIVRNDRRIEMTLKKLLKIPKPEATEIIIVDASEGSLDDVKEKFSNGRWIPFSGKGITIPEQRNLGIKKANGDIIVFIDADCIPEKNWLTEIVKPIRKEGEYFTSGKILSIGEKTIWDIGYEMKEGKKYIDECPTMNLAFIKDICKEIGYFDENFDYGSDIDFIWRTRKKNYRIRYNPSAIVYHDWQGSKFNTKRQFVYGKARAKLYKKHPHMWKNLFSNDVIVLFYPLYILFLPITYICPYYLLIIPLLLIRNFRNKPFQVVFGHLVYGLGVIWELLFPALKKGR